MLIPSDRSKNRVRVGCHPLNDRDRRVIGRIANTMCIKDAAAGLLRSVRVGQRYRNLVVDGGLARLRLLILRCGQSQRRGTGRKIEVDQVMDKLPDKASARRLHARAACLGLRQEVCPIGDPAGIAGIAADVDVERIDELTIGQAGIGCIEERSLRINEGLSQHPGIVERDRSSAGIGDRHSA